MGVAYQPDLDRCMSISDTYEPHIDVPMRSPRRPKIMVSPEFTSSTWELGENFPKLHNSSSVSGSCYSHYTHAASAPNIPLQTSQHKSCSCVNMVNIAGKDSNSSSDRSSLFSWDADSMGVESDFGYAREPLKSAIIDEYLDEITGEDEICCVDNVVTILTCHDQCDSRKVEIVAMS